MIREHRISLVMEWINEHNGQYKDIRTFWLIGYLEGYPDMIDDMCSYANFGDILEDMKQAFDKHLTMSLEDMLK